jgi:hypothetical protein
MAAVTVTATIGTTCHYWLTPEPTVAYDGSGLNVLDIVSGYSAESADETPASISLDLDDSTTWDIRLVFEGAPPIYFESLDVSGGGDLFELLQAQGWTP